MITMGIHIVYPYKYLPAIVLANTYWRRVVLARYISKVYLTGIFVQLAENNRNRLADDLVAI